MNFKNINNEESLSEYINQLTHWLSQVMKEVERCQNVSLKRLDQDLILWWNLQKDIEEKERAKKRDEGILKNTLEGMDEYTIMLLKKHWGVK